MELSEKYIVTENNLDVRMYQQLQLIHRNCQPFLKEWLKSFKGHNLEIWYRGMQSSVSFFQRDVRTERIPTNTDVELHLELDSEFNKRYGHKYRSNALFVTGDVSEANEYGSVFMIFPIGDFKYLWNERIDDLFLFTDILSGNKPEYSSGTYKEKLLSTYKSTNMMRAINSEVEIMLACKQYYGLRAKIYNNIILEWFKVYANETPTQEKFQVIWDKR